jgi:hypothetical protein
MQQPHQEFEQQQVTDQRSRPMEPVSQHGTALISSEGAVAAVGECSLNGLPAVVAERNRLLHW